MATRRSVSRENTHHAQSCLTALAHELRILWFRDEPSALAYVILAAPLPRQSMSTPTSHPSSLTATASWLKGGGEMGERIRAFDWSQTALGPLATWPSALKTIASTLLHSRHPMFLWWGPELIQLYNDAYLPSFGVGKHPLALGQRGRECWQEIWSVIGPQIDDVLLRGKPCWHEDALVPIFRNGALEDVYWTYGYSPVFDDAGCIAGVLVVCTETTGRVLAVEREHAARREAELERSRLRRFFEQAPAGICILSGPDFVFEFANELYCRMVGRSDLLGKPLLDALPELRGQGYDDLLRQVLCSNETFVGKETQAQLMRKDRANGTSESVFFTFIYSPVCDLAGVTEGVAVFALDVSEQVVARRQAEELARQVQKSEAEFRTLAESIPQLAWSAQPDGYVDWYNRRWYEYTGTTFEEMKGWGWRRLHDAGFVDEVERRWATTLSSGVDFEMEFPLRRSDGAFRWHLTRAVPLRDESGCIVRWFGTNTDIDDTKRAEAERSALLANAQTERARAEIANRAKDEFLATASHELRTPLNAILGWARLLRSGQLDASGYLRGVETIERNARAQVRLIEDILDGSRIITGKLHLEIRSLDMTQLVQAALDAVRPAAEAKGIALTLELDPEAAIMSGDPERLQQVVWNLANNAIKFTPKGGAVHVRLGRVESDIELSVADSGQGIDLDFLPHVFERFRQAEGSTTRRHGGLGLGLALVRHLVEAHGGTVRAESPGPGLGATFSARLPVRAVTDKRPDSVRPTPLPNEEQPFTATTLSGISVLVVDDEADARDLVATVLRAKGAEVTTAPNAKRALELLALSMPTVLISDIAMPELDGYELIRCVRALDPAGSKLPAIALTAYARQEDRRRALEAGFQTHVAKPVEPNELLRVVASVVQYAQQGAAGAAPTADSPRANTMLKLEKLLRSQGVAAALRFLNNRTSHRFTAIFEFDAEMLRNLHLVDAEQPEVKTGKDLPLSQAYCSIIAESARTFTTADSRRDDRLRNHAARDTLISYCGVLLRDEDGHHFGTLCHFDHVACDVPLLELPLMEGAASLLLREILEARRAAEPSSGASGP